MVVLLFLSPGDAETEGTDAVPVLVPSNVVADGWVSIGEAKQWINEQGEQKRSKKVGMACSVSSQSRGR